MFYCLKGVEVDEEKDGDEGCCVQLRVSFREAASPVSVFAQCCSNPALSVGVQGSVMKRVNYNYLVCSVRQCSIKCVLHHDSGIDIFLILRNICMFAFSNSQFLPCFRKSGDLSPPVSGGALIAMR